MSIAQALSSHVDSAFNNHEVQWQVAVLMLTIIIVGAFFNRDVPGRYSIGKYVDQRLGDGTYVGFMRRLKPELLFASVFLSEGLAGVFNASRLGVAQNTFSFNDLFICIGIACVGAYAIARWKGYYNLSPSIEIKKFSEAEAIQFWKEVKKRRTLVWLLFFGWLVAAPILLSLFSFVFPTMSENAKGMNVLVFWFALIIWANYRFTQMRCYSCGQKAFGNVLFLMKDAKCRCCGAKPPEVT